MMIRLGIEGGRRAVINRVKELSAPVLISANSLWDKRTQKFSRGRCDSYAGLDVALDSGGFVAMHRYGGYRWSVADYVKLAGYMRPAWWAQMDFCCEPELAADRESVRNRISMTVAHLEECERVADGENVRAPMPVLQGWRPEDYCRGRIYEQDQWPELVGVGSVCRRQVHGPDGVMAVVEALDQAVPAHVMFHLFGVKSTALAELLRRFPNRILSMDSMAWNARARWAGASASSARADFMEQWYERQVATVHGVLHDPQLDFFLNQ